MHRKKWFQWLVIAFVVFYVATRPEDAAAAFRAGLGALQSGFEAIIRFFGSVA